MAWSEDDLWLIDPCKLLSTTDHRKRYESTCAYIEFHLKQYGRCELAYLFGKFLSHLNH